MDLGQSTTTFGGDDHSWLGSAHGTESTDTITLDVSTFTEEDHYPDGWMPSGIVLGRITATDVYGPYDNAAVDGRAVAAGHLYAQVEIRTGADVGAALFRHGKVRRGRLPDNHGLDAAAEADLKGQIIYVD